VEARLSPGPLAEALERRRERFNARFVLARRASRRLDPDAFAGHLIRVVDPLVRAVAAAAPDRVDAAMEALFDLSLELLGGEVLGPTARRPAPGQVWTEVLPAMAPLLAREPRRVAAALTNAAVHVAAEPGARPGQWLECVRRAGEVCRTVDELLAAGQAAAWRAGLAHFREGALAALRSLELAPALRALGLRDGDYGSRELLDVALRERWRDPGAPASGVPALACVARVGGFRGFGGPFVTPPQAFVAEGALCVADEEGCWSLFADAFGCTFRRRSRPAPDPAEGTAAPRLEADGRLQWLGLTASFPFLAGAQGIAADGTTLAVTLPRSHFLFLVARVGG
jgi:hypothetical protein